MKSAHVLPSVLTLLAITTSGCAGGTGVGNPINGGGVTLASKGYNAASASGGIPGFFIADALAATSIYSFKFCVTQMKLAIEDGSSVTQNGSDALEAKLGLIDLGNGSQATTWGTVAIPSGVAIKRLKIVVHKDSDTCGSNYSASINDQAITKDMEFKFALNNAKALKAGDAITLSVATLVNKLSQAYLGNHLNDQDIGGYLDGSFEDQAD